MDHTIILFYITCPNLETANSLGQQLVENKQAACTNVFPIQSTYFWDNQMQNDQEYVLLAKTTEKCIPLVHVFVEENHPYELPCIMHFSVQANARYAQWIRESVVSLQL